ncbi:hypothetical protein [Photobacterium damselae]|uniref:hypothetical protein n=1 Tax=Photobacterium damselae TaxID=38293 RepID=UPI0040677648
MFNHWKNSNYYAEEFIANNKPINSLFTPSSGEVWLIYFNCRTANNTEIPAASRIVDHCLATFTPELINHVTASSNYLSVLKKPTPIRTDCEINFKSLLLTFEGHTSRPCIITFLKNTTIALAVYNIGKKLIFVSIDIKLEEFIII